MAICGCCGAIGAQVETTGLFIGESVVKSEGCGGGSETFIRSPKTGLTGEVVEGRLDLRGDRPSTRAAGGSKTMSLVLDMSIGKALPDEAGRAR